MLFITTLILATAVFAVEKELSGEAPAMSAEQVEKEKLAFIERGIVEVLRHAYLPQLFEAKLSQLEQCGCQYGPSNILWGSRVGMTCKLDQTVDTENESDCGIQCLSPRGETVLLLCPKGWTQDCATGCVPPVFTSVRERTDFLEEMLDKIVLHGYDYLHVNDEYMASCGCTEKRLTKIRFGTRIGLECVFNDEKYEETECGGFGGCKNEAEQGVMIFCPSGHTPTCMGCEKTLEVGTSLDERISWLVELMTTHLREVQSNFRYMRPTGKYAVDCGCSHAVVEVKYGHGVGYWCQVDDVAKIGDNCGANVLCENTDKNLILHMCPAGFVPDCTQGCGYAWKQEL